MVSKTLSSARPTTFLNFNGFSSETIFSICFSICFSTLRLWLRSIPFLINQTIDVVALTSSNDACFTVTSAVTKNKRLIHIHMLVGSNNSHLFAFPAWYKTLTHTLTFLFFFYECGRPEWFCTLVKNKLNSYWNKYLQSGLTDIYIVLNCVENIFVF